uniref:START domain-containing protein n=1 Tax=Ascaris lumbricoides TaxID=6252 RepID=A0A9J2PEQ8_ASCLU
MSSIDDPLLTSDSGMGKDRRRFLIVSVFDFCLIVLLWLICTVTKGNDWPTVFLREIDIFEAQFMKISLFDIVIIAVCRMLVLVFSYAVLLVDHWIPVAATTIITTLFLVIKVLFFFSRDQGSLPQYLVILSSFMVAWFELWLVPFRVLPRERRQVVAPQIESPTVSTVRVRNVQTDDEFRSAMEYSSGSDAEDNKMSSNLLRGKVYSKAEYIEAVDRAEQTARQLIRQVDSWKLICRDNPEIRYCEERRVYYVRAEIACTPQSLFRAAWKDNQLWNKQVLEMRVLLHIDSTTELLYSVSAPALRGYIASRDFLDVRRIHLDTDKDVYEGWYVSVDSSVLPANSNKKMVRGFNGPNLVRVSRSSTTPDISVFEWMLSSDVKGDIPRRLIERTMSSFLLGYVRNLRNFISDRASEYP